MAENRLINLKSLKEQVYDYLREQMRIGELRPGAEINLDQTSQKLGVSRTPLRDALLQLEIEGFVTIFPRRGVVVKPLTLEEIRESYEIIGSLESTALLLGYKNIGPQEIERMEELVRKMKEALEKDDFDGYYNHNLSFHEIYLRRCGNQKLVKIVHHLKKRLYDFPRQKGYVKEWEWASVLEHENLIRLLRERKPEKAASYIRDVHWSFPVQEKYINIYYRGIGAPAAREPANSETR